jgi:Secretion system C-terminal sorting domain
LRVTDAADDGLYYWFYPANGQGFARMRYNGTISRIFNPDFGRFFQYDFYTEGPVSNDVTTAQRFFVSPNPSAGAYHVELEGFAGQSVEIEVYDLQGRSLYHRNAELAGGHLQTQLDLSGQPAGTYLLRLRAGDQLLSRTLVKQ